MKKLLIWFFIIGCTTGSVNATHLMGGSLTYTSYGADATTRTADYEIMLNIYRYCEPGSAPLAPNFQIAVCYDSSLASFNGKPLYRFVDFPQVYTRFIDPPNINVNCSFNASACVEKGVYVATVTLPVDTAFHIILITGARNGNILNVQYPDSSGMTFYTYIPQAPNLIINNSPEINDIPVPYVCNGDTVFYNYNSYDPDGDSLVYSFVHPYGFSSYINDNSYIEDLSGNIIAVKYPLQVVNYNPGYNYLLPFGAGGYASIDKKTGLAKFVIPNQGFYVVAVEIKEYSNGVLVSTIRRDIQIIVLACPPNQTPRLQASSAATLLHTVTEQDSICLNLVFTDADADSISLQAVGSLFNPSSVNPPATLTVINGDSIATAQFCWQPICGQARTAPYQFTISAFDDGCPPKFSEYIFTVKVDSFAGNIVPSVTIEQSPDSSFCTGTPITFNAKPINQGLNPLYNWFVNGNKVGNNSPTYTDNNFVNLDIVNLTMTSSSLCASNPIANSNDIVLSAYQSPVAQFAVTPLSQTIFTPNFTFNNQSQFASTYFWNYGDGSSDTLLQNNHLYNSTGIIEVSLIATSAQGCTDTAAATIEITDQTTLYIPNSFTPNNDGINDKFSIAGNALPEYSLQIFNRWGQLIFSGNKNYVWDGTFNGRLAPISDYIYHLKFNSKTFNKTYTGTIALVR